MADAEAATARLVAQMTESSPDQNHRPLQIVTAHKQGDVLSAHNMNDEQQQQQHQQHSSDWENMPQVQQHAGKRSSSGHAAAAADVEAGGKKQPAKRRKVFKDTAPVHPPAEGEGCGKDDGLPPDAKEIVGRAVQQQFEEGVFQVSVSCYRLSDGPCTQGWGHSHRLQGLHYASMHIAYVQFSKQLITKVGWLTGVRSLCRVSSRATSRSTSGFGLSMKTAIGPFYKLTCCSPASST